jgi:hypothetical protein
MMRQMGGSFGIAFINTFLDHRTPRTADLVSRLGGRSRDPFHETHPCPAASLPGGRIAGPGWRTGAVRAPHACPGARSGPGPISLARGRPGGGRLRPRPHRAKPGRSAAPNLGGRGVQLFVAASLRRPSAGRLLGRVLRDHPEQLRSPPRRAPAPERLRPDDALVALARTGELSAKDALEQTRSQLGYQTIQAYYGVLLLRSAVSVSDEESAPWTRRFGFRRGSSAGDRRPASTY